MNICLYGGADPTLDAVYIHANEALGQCMAKRGHTLVFGGGANGMMGAAARGAASAQGRIIGIVPSFFNVDGVLFDRCDEMHYTATMRERKKRMEESADAFVMTPGGIGTLDEFFEILTLRSLGQHQKPIVIFNVNGCFDDLIAFLTRLQKERFVGQKTLHLFSVFSEPDELIDYLEKLQKNA